MKFADGLFETVYVDPRGGLPWLAAHLLRLQQGAGRLEIGLPTALQSPAAFAEEAGEWLRAEGAGKPRGLRLTLWRGGGGGYCPETEAEAGYLAELRPLEREPFALPQPQVLWLDRRFPLVAGPFSAYKTLQKLPNVLASKKAAEHGCTDALLLGIGERLAEAASANLLLLTQEGRLCTPPLTAGCLAGLVRSRLLAEGEIAEHALLSTELFWADLPGIQAIWTMNSLRGFRPVQAIRDADGTHWQGDSLGHPLTAALQSWLNRALAL